jgi:hypothetical protein
LPRYICDTVLFGGVAGEKGRLMTMMAMMVLLVSAVLNRTRNRHR